MIRFQHLIVTLPQGHQALKECIVAVQANVRSYGEVRPALRALEDVLMRHLGRQDQSLFKELEDFFCENHHDLKMIEFLLHDLKDMKIKLLAFFDEYSGAQPIQEARSLPKEFNQFKEDILNRIRVEEEYFLPLLVKASEQL